MSKLLTASRSQGLPLAARTAGASLPNLSGLGHRGVRVYLDITAASGTGGLSVILRAVGPRGTIAPLNTGGSPQTTTGLKVYDFYPNAAAAAAGVVDAASRRLPKLFELAVTAGDGSSYTYQLDYELLD